MKIAKTLLFALLSVLLMLSCDTDIDDEDNNFILLELRGDEDLSFTNPSFTLNLYGENDTIADATEVLLATQNFEAEDFPFQVRLELPADPYAPIPNLEDNTNARFFLEILWDSDNSGKLCRGDIDLDHSIGNVDLININRRDPQLIFLSPIPETTPCE